MTHLPHSSLAAVFLLGLTTVFTGCSRDPSRIVYQVSDVETNQNDLFVIREDGSHDAVLANSPDDEAACGVTTDRRIVFTRHTPTGGDIYIVNEDGTGLRPLRATPDDEICFGVTGNNMVIFAIARPPVNLVPNHDLYSVSANSAPTTVPITLAASLLDELPVAIGWDNRVIFARREAHVDDHFFSFYSIADDGTNLARVVGVFEKPTFVAVSRGNRMIWSVPTSSTSGPPDTYNVLAGLNQFRHNRQSVGDVFSGFTTYLGRVLLTSRYKDSVFDPNSITGDIYMINDDGTNVVHINPRPPGGAENEMCLAGNDLWVIVGQYAAVSVTPPSLYDNLHSLWSYPASGAGTPIQLAAGARTVSLTFQGLTPHGRVLFTKTDHIGNTQALQSIAPDGTDLQTLARSSSLFVWGFTPADGVIFSINHELQGDLEIVPSRGQAPMTPLSTRSGVNLLSFVYYLDSTYDGRATRCRICRPGTDIGGSPLPIGPPFP